MRKEAKASLWPQPSFLRAAGTLTSRAQTPFLHGKGERTEVPIVVPSTLWEVFLICGQNLSEGGPPLGSSLVPGDTGNRILESEFLGGWICSGLPGPCTVLE